MFLDKEEDQRVNSSIPIHADAAARQQMLDTLLSQQYEVSRQAKVAAIARVPKTPDTKGEFLPTTTANVVLPEPKKTEVV